MALVVVPSKGPANVDPTSSLRDALQKFQRTLPTEQQKIFNQQHQKPEAPDVLKFVADLDANNQSRSGRCVASRVCTFLEALQQFTGVVDTFISSNPSIAALVWGAVKTALIVAGNATSYFDKVTTMIMNVGRSCPVIALFGPLYPGCVGLQEALCGYYSAIVKLCVKVVEVQQRTGLKYVWSSLTNPFESEFKSILEAIDSSVQLVHLHINLASKQAATETAKLMEMDRKANEAFRLSSFKFRKEVAQEREDARVWRMRNAQRNAEKLRRDIKDRLSSLDHLKPWKQAQRRRMASTAEWFQRNPVFEEWRKDPRSAVLWCGGLMGAGKTVFASNVVSHLLRTREKDEVVAHHFCQTDLKMSLSAREIIGTLARQMIDPHLGSIEDVELHALYDQCADADVSDLLAIIRSHVDDDKTYLILIDGLDECTKEDIETVAASIADLRARGIKCVKVVYVGRPGLEEYLFRQLSAAKYRLPITKAAVTPDIKTYIMRSLDQCLENGWLRLSDPILIVKIRETLEKQADGMFLWAYLFIDEICAQSTDDEILKALQDSPKQLSTLLDLKIARVYSTRAVHQAIKVLQMCGVAKRPLSMNELRELISISVGQDTLDVTRLPHRMEEIVNQCGGLLYIDEEDLSVQYVHHSIQQYLFSHHGQHQKDFAKEEQDEHLGFLTLTYLHFKELGRQLAKVETDAKTGKVAQLLLRHQNSLRGLSKDELVRKAQELTGQTENDRLNLELTKRRFHFLHYARKYWIFHLAHSDMAKNGKMKRLFESCVNGSNELAQRPWSRELDDRVEAGIWAKKIDDVLDWAVINGHCGLFRYCVGVEDFMFSERQIVNICVKTPPASLQIFMDIVIRRTKHLEAMLGKTIVKLAKEALWDDLTLILDRIGCSNSGSLLPWFNEADVQEIEAADTLMIVADHGQLNVLNGLLLTGLNVRICGLQALRAAVQGGHLAIVDRLLQVATLDFNAIEPRSGCTVLQMAARSGNPDMVNTSLLSGPSCEAISHTGRMTLSSAANGRYVEVVERLLSAGADVNFNTWTSPLGEAVACGYTETVDRLLSAGANVDNRNVLGETALHLAAGRGFVKVVDRLLLAGADIDATAGPHKSTALSWAAERGHIEVVDRLLLAGADVNAVNDYDLTALQLAVVYGYSAIADRLRAAGAVGRRKFRRH